MRHQTFPLFILVSGLWHVSSSDVTCRLSKQGDLSQPDFATVSCHACYNYSYFKAYPLDNKYFQNVSYPSMMEDAAILMSLKHAKTQQNWKTCCKQAVQCCNQMASLSFKKPKNWCPRTWDGWLCWPDSANGTTTNQSCPSFINPCSKGEAVKTCNEDGTWFVHPNSSREWTDYSQCSGAVRETLAIFLSLGAYVTSLLMLTPALYIFYTFSILQCFRVILHRNLFLSLLLHCCAKITFDCAFLLPEVHGNGDKNTIGDNSVWCRLLSAGIVYLTVSNYMWMLCEGLLLCRQLVNAFAPESRTWIFYILGWGAPTLSLIVSVAFRLTSDDTNCWALPSVIDWVWLLPCLLSLLINCVFFIYILTVVVRTLSRQISDNVIQFRKAVRAGLVLVPLFGLHFVLTIYRPTEPCSTAEEYYSYILRLVEGLQGCIVAVTYCYINSEVRSALRRAWRVLTVRQQIGQGQVNYMSAISTQTVL